MSLNSGTAGSDALSNQNCSRCPLNVPTNGTCIGSVECSPNVESCVCTGADHADTSAEPSGHVPVLISGSGCASTGNERPSPGCVLVLSSVVSVSQYVIS